MDRSLTAFAGFCGAVFLAVYTLPPQLWPWLGLAAGLTAAVTLLLRREGVGLALLGVAVALLWCTGSRALFYRPALDLDGRRTPVTVALLEAPRDESGAAGCYVLPQNALPIRATFHTDLPDLAPGDRITVLADCAAARTGSADFGNGVYLTVTAQGEPAVEKAAHAPWWTLPTLWGNALRDSLLAAFPQDVAGFLSSVTLGGREDLDDGLRQAMSDAGVAHLAAVSGMHLMFLMTFAAALSGKRLLPKALVGIPLAVLFALTVGGTPSVVRAAAMQVLVLVAPLAGRDGRPFHSLAFVLTLLLAANPFSCTDLGLQLSFAAAAGMYAVTPRLRGRLPNLRPREDEPRLHALIRKGLDKLNAALAASVGALMLTTPIVVLRFSVLSLVGPLVSVLLLPLVGLLFLTSLGVALLGFLLPGAARFLGGALAWPARLAIGVIRAAARVPYAALHFTSLYYPLALLGCYALLLTALLAHSRRRARIFLPAGAAMLLAAILFTTLSFRAGDLTAAVLDVGQGLSVVLTSGGHTALVDCGGTRNAGAVAADYLRDRGEDTLDYLILTHYHADHTNGLAALMSRLTVSELILPQPAPDADAQAAILTLAERYAVPVTWLDATSDVALGQTRLRLYAPMGDGGANEEGLAVLASAGDFDVLITGDMPEAVERRLVKYNPLPVCEVLVAGHHGAAASSGDALLDAIRPRTALISVGAGNSYGHPSDAALDRFALRSIPVYRTDLLGTLTAQSYGP